MGRINVPPIQTQQNTAGAHLLGLLLSHYLDKKNRQPSPEEQLQGLEEFVRGKQEAENQQLINAETIPQGKQPANTLEPILGPIDRPKQEEVQPLEPIQQQKDLNQVAEKPRMPSLEGVLRPEYNLLASTEPTNQPPVNQQKIVPKQEAPLYPRKQTTAVYNALALGATGAKPGSQRLIVDENGEYRFVPVAEGATGFSQKSRRVAKMEVQRDDDGNEKVMIMWYDPTNPALPPIAGGEVRDPLQVAKIRAESFAKTRVQVVYDANNDYAPRIRTIEQIVKEPNRWLPYMATQKALDKTALLNDMDRTIQNVKTSLAKLQPFNNITAGQFAEMVRRNEPKEVVGPWVQFNIGRTLTTDQASYLIDLLQLRENSLALRSVLNAGPGSDQLRDAILQTLPNSQSPNKEYALMQLVKYEETLQSLGQGVPPVKLVKPGKVFIGQPRPGGVTGGAVSGNGKGMTFNPKTGQFE